MLALALFANGGNQTRAYHQVYPHVTRDSARALAAKAFAEISVREAVERHRLELRERVQVDTEALAQRLLAQANGNLSDVAEWGGTKGLQLKPSHELTPEAQALIEEVEDRMTKDGPVRKVKLVNRTAAARLLLELRGELVKQVKVEGEMVHRVVALPEKQPTREEWAERYAPGKRVKATVESAEANER